MDELRFDALARRIGGGWSRREALRFGRHVALAAALGATTWPAAEAKKKKKKKCKKPKVKCGRKCCPAGQVCSGGKCASPGCQFTKTATTWTLEADCTTTSIIEIPNGVTLDGNNKTISGAGVAAKAGQSNVKNLTLVGSGGLLFEETAGAITDVSVSGATLGINGSGGQEVTLTRVAVNSSSGDGMLIVGSRDTIGVQVEIDDCDIEDIFGVGVSVVRADVAITNTRIENVNTGVQFDGESTGSVDGCQIENVEFVGVFAMDGSTVNVTDNTIVGPGAISTLNFGVGYNPDTAGTVSGNTISNFKDSDSGQTSCGIFIDAAATGVTLGTNTFPDPPGNEQNICDHRP